DSIIAFDLGVNPVSMEANIAYISDRESSADEKLNLLSFDGQMWNYVGDKDFSPSRARSLDLTFSNSGVPYISFADDGEEGVYGSVMSYDSGWDYVGGGNFSGIKSGVTTVSVGESDEVYGFFYVDERIDTRREVAAKVFNGTWNDLPITGRAGYTRELRSKEVNGDIYLGVLDYGEGQSVSVYKYSNGIWIALADHMKK